MFIGHFGVGFGAKKFAPEVSLGFLFLAAQFIDLLWPTLLLLGLEHVVISPGITKATPLDFIDYPISHSLLMVIFWGLLLAFITRLFIKNYKIPLIIFLAVVSHWFLDLIVHRPDLPVIPGNPFMMGFGLWNFPYISFVAEGIIFIAGILLYYKATSSKNKFGKYGLIALIVLLVLIQIGNMLGSAPPDVNAIAWAGQLQWLFVVLAFFADKNRLVKK